MDVERRDELLGRAIRFAMNDQPLTPVFYPILDFAARLSAKKQRAVRERRAAVRRTPDDAATK